MVRSNRKVITRTLDLAHPQEKVRIAPATRDGITSWFGSHDGGEMVLATTSGMG